jgi:hypothetical protein
MELNEQQEYLTFLIKQLEKQEDKTLFNNFIVLMEDLLKTKYLLRNYLNYPISAAQYDELITYAENVLGISTSLGRTNDATSVDSARSIDKKLNNMMWHIDRDNHLVTDALVDYSLSKEDEWIPKAFTDEWDITVAGLVDDIKTIEGDEEIIQELERKLLDFLKGTL